MNNDLINLLKNNSDYISGEELSQKFNISRAAIWKQIRALKEAGYEIEGVSKKGYKLISCPDLIIEKEISDNLTTSFIGKNIKYYNEVTSTNEVAKTLANESVDGTLIISEKQFGGKGRLGRVWSSPLGGIWTSIIIKPEIEPINANKITQIAAASLIKVLHKYNVNAKIKWPNDIYINNKKFAGILTEMKCDMDRIHYLIVGIGMNINISNFPDEISKIATSIKLETNKEYNRSEFLANFLNEFENLYLDFINHNNFKSSLDICKNNSILLDKDAYLITSNNKEKVHCIGINDDGMLIIKDSKGEIKSVISGEITFHE